MTLLSRFLFAWRHAKLSAYDESADALDFWTEEDGLYWRSIFQSSTGQKMKRRLTNFTFKAAIAATRSPQELAHYCGRAQGAMDTVLFIQQHFSPEPKRESEIEPELKNTSAMLDAMGLEYSDG